MTAQRGRVPAALTHSRTDAPQPSRRDRWSGRGCSARLPGTDVLRLPQSALRTLGFSERKAQTILVGAGLEDDPDAALARWAPDAGLVYFHLLLRGLEQRAAGVQRPETRAS